MDKSLLFPTKDLIHYFVFSALFVLFLSEPSAAQNQTPRMTTTSSIYYYEYLPPDYLLNTNKYPVVFFMHGLGERGNALADLVNVAKHGPPKYVKNGYKFPFILISPQLKTNFGDWPPWYIDEVVEYAKSTLRIDTRRIYITGMSLGGGGAWYYAQTYPDKVAALAPVCGSRNTPSKACLLAASNIPVWAFHGDKDGVVSMAKSVNMVNAINACVPSINPKALLTIYPGIAHNAWDNAYRTDHLVHNPNVYEWMMQWVNGGVTVNVGPDITLTLPINSTSITGTASTEGGTITSYSWTKVSGPGVTIANASTPTVSLTNMVEGIYTFRLTSTNSNGESAFDEVKITIVQPAVNQSPVANAGADVSITLPTNSLNLSGLGSDADGSIGSYAWTQVSGPAATMTGAGTATLGLSGLVQGTYVFSLTVTDNLGATGSDNVTVTVSPAAVNQNPTANAGLDKTINLPTNSTNLTGTGSDPDGTISSYLWEKVSGPTVTMTNTTSTTVSLSSLVAGTYVFQLKVTDNQGATATDQVTVTVVAANQSPVASAGSDITITLPTNTTNINGSGSDPDGSIANYTWIKVSGPTATLTNTNTATLTASGLTQGTYVFRLTVTDDKGSTGSDDVQVIVNAAPVNQPPVANAGPDFSITLPTDSVTITGTGTDPDGTITIYKWTKSSGPSVTLVSTNTPVFKAKNMVAGTYIFKLSVTDNSGSVRSDNVTVTVQPAAVNQTPIANAGPDIGLTLPTNSTLVSGSGTDNDGTIATYSWTKISGPTATVAGQSTATLQLSDLVDGAYVFQLTVTDDKGATHADQVSITVNAANVPPTANAGTDITINLPTDSTGVIGAGTDPDGTIASYAWVQISGPNSATLTNETTSTVSADNLVAGTYVLQLTVTDEDGDTDTDDVKIIVNAANQTPTANAGADQSITLPTNSTNFTGVGTDPDGTIASYAWTQIAGAPVDSLANESTSTVTVYASTSGIYTFRFIVTDNAGAQDFDDVTLTVNSAIINQAPTANAGSNQSITLPTNSVTLNGSGSDPDGAIDSYLWVKTSGPSATLSNDSSPVLSVNDMLEGSYVFKLTVTDNGSTPLSASDEVTVTVLPAVVNQPPVANAGADQTVINPPTTSLTIFGNGSDADGTVASYAWVQLSGPAITISNDTLPNVTISDLVVGVYEFRLTITDDDGATDEDDVQIVVNSPAVNQPPVANAGPNKTITLPTNITNLTGSGSDPDGTISRYTWSKVSGPTVTMGATDQPTLSVSNLIEGSYVFRIEVEDDDAATDTDDVIVSVIPAATNQPPVVNADNDKTIFLPITSITLSGSASDADGSIITYQWIQIAGPATALLTNATTATLTADSLNLAGTYRFRLTATDDDGASTFDEVQVTVNAAATNQPPGADAGSDVTTKLTAIDLTGSGVDADGSIVSYLWTKVGGPTVVMTNANTPTVSLSGMTPGIYQFQLTVTDDDGDTGSDLVTVNILPPTINTAPVATAGPDVNVVLPQNSIKIGGSWADDGTTVTVLWEKISGPSVNMSGTNTDSLSLTNLVEGTYVFRYTANDGSSSDFDDITVNVFPEPIENPAPSVEVGEDIVLPYPENTISVIAVANAPDGLITSYKWSLITGEPIELGSDTTNTLEITDLQPGIYIFRITVIDGLGQEASDEIQITVMGPEAQPSNMFSPNGDTVDPTWTIQSPLLLEGCEIKVYNRQGLKVFESIGYATEWDGVFNGKPLPEGVYFYVIRCDGAKAQTGSVTLIR
jgi:gliding motility-associated-like protein